jgi:hypothetical protein
MENAPIFVVGVGRSGTGLLRDLLRSHPRLSFPPESLFIPPFYRAYGDPRNEREARRTAAAILSRSRLRYWDLDGLSSDDFAYYRSFSAITDHIFRWCAEREGKPRWGDKTPAYTTEIPLLSELFPEARFLHIYRDGRDVSLSRLQSLWGAENVVATARLWRQRVSAARRAARELPAGRYLELSYERLVQEPEPTMREVCAFIGEEFVSDVLVPTRRAFSVGGSPNEWERPGYRRSITMASIGAWRTKMGAGDRDRFERVAADQLTELGYPVLGDARPLTRAERAIWTADDWSRRARRVLRERPPIELRNPLWLRPALAAERLRRRLAGSRTPDVAAPDM